MKPKFLTRKKMTDIGMQPYGLATHDTDRKHDMSIMKRQSSLKVKYDVTRNHTPQHVPNQTTMQHRGEHRSERRIMPSVPTTVEYDDSFSGPLPEKWNTGYLSKPKRSTLSFQERTGVSPEDLARSHSTIIEMIRKQSTSQESDQATQVEMGHRAYSYCDTQDIKEQMTNPIF